MPTESDTLSRPSPAAPPQLPETTSPIPVGSFLAAGLSVSLAACGGGGSDDPSPTTPPASGSPTPAPAPTAGTPVAPPASSPPAITPAPAPVGYAFTKATDDNQAAAFLQQAQFGSTKSQITAVRSLSYAAWLNQQYAQPMSESATDWLLKRGYYDFGFTNNFYISTYPVDFMLWKQLMSGSDEVRQRFALALSEYFVVSMSGSNFIWQIFGYARWWDLLKEHAFGNFRDLLDAVTLNVAMGFYLNTRGNSKEDANGRVPDENYSREVMQLFTIGLYQLNTDGSIKKDAQGRLLDSYTQADVTNLAKVFTGYNLDTTVNQRTTIKRADDTTFTIDSREFASKPMRLDPTKHSTLEAKFLGATVPANTSGPESLKIAMDTLFNHPNVGPFFGKQMIQRLVTSNPSPAYVKRVADAFNNNGKNVRGDLKAVWSAILLDDEARNPQNASSTTHGKLREPMVRFIQWGRTFGVKSLADSWKITETSSNSTRLGQSPLRSPSVFNFFRPGFVPPGTELAVTKSVAPELQIVNETQTAGYLNFMVGALRNGFSVRGPEFPQLVPNTTAAPVNDIFAAYVDELALVQDADALMAHVNTVVCAGRLSAANVKLAADALKATPLTATSTDGQKLDRIAAAIYMAMASSDYLVQR